MEFTFEERSKIGFQYILDLMDPCSPYGQERLRRIRAYRPDERDELETELYNLGQLKDHMSERSREIHAIRHGYMQMKDIRRAVKKAREMCLSDIELFEIKNFLLCTERTAVSRMRLTIGLELKDLEYRNTRKALELLDPEGRLLPAFGMYDSFSEKLREIRVRKRAVERRLADAAEEEREAIQEERRLIVVEEEEEELKIRQRLTDELRPYLDDIEYNAEMTGRWDLLLEKAGLANKAKTVRPVIAEGPLKLRQAVSPYVADILKEERREFTPIDIELGRGSTVITGANMGGKSVALHTVALNTYLALCGFYVYAESAEIPHFEDIVLVSDEMQSVKAGLSGFGAEVAGLERAVEAAERSYCLILVDEFARGTNPHEGEQLVRAVVKFFNESRNAALFVTHYDHIAEHAAAHYQVKGLAEMDPEKVQYEIAAAGKAKGAQVIASHMNYGLIKVADAKECPKEALAVCRLLGLDERIMALAEEE